MSNLTTDVIWEIRRMKWWIVSWIRCWMMNDAMWIVELMTDVIWEMCWMMTDVMCIIQVTTDVIWMLA